MYFLIMHFEVFIGITENFAASTRVMTNQTATSWVKDGPYIMACPTVISLSVAFMEEWSNEKEGMEDLPTDEVLLAVCAAMGIMV